MVVTENFGRNMYENNRKLQTPDPQTYEVCVCVCVCVCGGGGCLDGGVGGLAYYFVPVNGVRLRL
jgi:hypothetical protein